MPELPEVKTVSYHLNKTLANKRVKNVEVRLEKILKGISKKNFVSELKDKKLLKVHNEGKWIVFDFEDDIHVIVHLRLEGKFRTEHVEGIKEQHDHIIINFEGGIPLKFNDTRQFGTFHLIKGDYKNVKPISNLGSMIEDINIDEFYKRISGRKIAIKTLMLDQTLLIGLGNIYINEALWYAKINPARPANQVSKSELESLLKYSKSIMDKSYELGGSSIATYSSLNGIKGNYQKLLKVHMKQNNPCERCDTPIEKNKVNGRGTYFCPKCQKS